MTSCCTGRCCGTDRFFSRLSGHFDRQYTKHGLEKIQRFLLEGLPPTVVRGSTVLDIGCGVGALHLALLRRGAASAVGVEISEGMLKKARHHASELGFGDRTAYLQGDFVERQAEVLASDVTLLDKVVCCYGDARALLASAASKTKELLAITRPRSNVLAAFLFMSHIALARLFRLAFHPFWHDWEAIQEEIVSHGFVLHQQAATVLWQGLIYRRAQSGTRTAVPSQGAHR